MFKTKENFARINKAGSVLQGEGLIWIYKATGNDIVYI